MSPSGDSGEREKIMKVTWGKGRKPQIMRDLEAAAKEIEKIVKKASKW